MIGWDMNPPCKNKSNPRHTKLEARIYVLYVCNVYVCMFLNKCTQGHTCVITFVCVRVCAYVSVRLCACAHVWLHGYTDLCTFASIYVSTSARVILCMYASMDAWIHECTNTCIRRQTDGQTDRQADRWTERQTTEKQTCKHAYIRAYVWHT